MNVAYSIFGVIDTDSEKLFFSNRSVVLMGIVGWLSLAVLSQSFWHLGFLGGILFLSALMLYIRPAYAFEGYTHLGLTMKSLENLQGDKPFSSLKEINDYLGKIESLEQWQSAIGKSAQSIADDIIQKSENNATPENEQGLAWTSIAEDYLPDIFAVKNHFYNPIARSRHEPDGLSDWEGEDDCKVLGLPAGWAARTILSGSNVSAATKAQEFWDKAIKAYIHGSIRDAYSYLGRVIHLLEDMIVPSHARNDNHPGYQAGFNLPSFNDHLYYDSLEKWCDSKDLTIPEPALYAKPFQSEEAHFFKYAPTGVSGPSEEIKKYFPHCGNTYERPYENETYPTSWNYLYGSDGKARATKLNISDAPDWRKLAEDHDIKQYVEKMAEYTWKRWWSDDTIPGNKTCPNTYDQDWYRDRSEEEEWVTQIRVGQGQILDSWNWVKDSEGNPLTEETIEKMSRIERALALLRLDLDGEMLSLDDLQGLIQQVFEESSFESVQNLFQQALEGDINSFSTYSAFPKMKNIIFNSEKNKNRWDIIGRRRYRLNPSYLSEMVKDTFPELTDKAALLMQSFYDTFQHVDLRGDDESIPRKIWEDEPLIIKETMDNVKKDGWTFTIWLENFGGVKDDFEIELGEAPEGWEISVEPDSERPGCKNVEGEMRERSWVGVVTEVEPTPQPEPEESWLSGKPSLDERTYDEPFKGERGAKLIVSVTPPNSF
jgi:hypothetical protein